MTYRVEVNHCNCHPETCNCSLFRIVNEENGRTVARGNNIEDLKELVNDANRR